MQYFLIPFISSLLLTACSSGSSSNGSGFSLVFSIQPNNATPLGTTTDTITTQVEIVDANGQVMTSRTDPITITIDYQPNTGIYTGLLGGTTTVNAVNGLAIFDNLNISQIGSGYRLKASLKTGITETTSVTSQPITITPSHEGYTSQNGAESGYEIAYVGGLGSNFQGYIDVYIDKGNNPIDAHEFETFSEPGYIKNTPRKPIFNYTNTLGSPNTQEGALTIATIGGYTWGWIAQVQSYDWPFNQANYDLPYTNGWEAGSLSATVPAGVIKYTSNNKNQLTLFTVVDETTQQPILRFFIVDQWGNMYLMKSTNALNQTASQIEAAFDAAILPAGWTKIKAYLTQDLYVNPAYGNINNLTASYNEFRDSGDNSYCQVAWAETGNSIAAQIGYPMPIWGGAGGGRINGTTGNDIIYGSMGNDIIYPYAGNDSINGGNGINTVVLTGYFNQYTISNSNGTITVNGPSGTKTLVNIQYLKFDDLLIPLTNFY